MLRSDWSIQTEPETSYLIGQWGKGSGYVLIKSNFGKYSHVMERYDLMVIQVLILQKYIVQVSSSDTTEIKALFASYESALRESSTTAVLPLYTPSGIFMAQHFPTAIGHTAIKAAYDKVFDTIVLAPSFTVHEIEIINDEWAFARTSSAGSTKIKASGKMVKEGNQELFVLQKVDGQWKFARYCFCTVLPPGGAL